MPRILIISDTHNIDTNTLKHVINEAKIRGCQIIIHCGDIEAQHINSELFLDLPVFCALNAEQIEKSGFKIPPINWDFTQPMAYSNTTGRYRDVAHTRCYIGHKRSFDFLKGSEIEFQRVLDQMRKDNDGLRLVFSGHTHHQILFQTKLVRFINPGAISDSYDGYEFAIVDTDNDEIIFSRIPITKSLQAPFSVGVISDSLKISESDVDFWKKLSKEFEDRGVKYIIHCGNIATKDIGREELNNFIVYFYSLPGQQNLTFTSKENWHQVRLSDPLIEINGYHFLIQFNLALELLDKSEVEMHRYVLGVKRDFPDVDFILYGSTPEPFLEEQDVCYLNPGDAFRGRHFSVICLPRKEITFGHVPVDPLPML